MKLNDSIKGQYRHIDFSPPDIGELEIEEVVETLRSGWITTGPRTKELEKRLAEYIGTNKVMCLNSATAAEELIFRICGIGKGDEVIVPAYTYTSTAAAAIHVGAKVILIDSQPNSVEMDYEAVENAINEHTKAIVPVDIGGIVCDYERLFSIVEKRREKFIASGVTDLGNRIQKNVGRILIIADCAHSLGAKRLVNNEWKMAGNIADFSSFSFHAVKNFTTAEGGAAVWKKIDGIDDEEIYYFFQLLSLHGQSKDALAKTQLGAWEYDIIGPWFKCNMTDIMAAIGLKQLERYSELLRRRRQMVSIYDKAMDELGVEYIKHYTKDMLSSGHLYITRIPGIGLQQRQEIITKMAEKGVVCNVHYKPLPFMSGYKEIVMDGRDYPNALNLYKNELTLPLHTRLNNVDVEYVIERYKEIIRHYI